MGSMRDILALLAFVAAVVLVGAGIGAATAPGAWYAGLEKPFFNPPNWVFGPVWTAIYAMIGVAGWLVWRRAPTSEAMALWGAQMLLNWLWSPVFFAMQAPGAAIAVILALLATILVFIAAARHVDVRASWLFAPYALWVGFATVLNIEIWRLN